MPDHRHHGDRTSRDEVGSPTLTGAVAMGTGWSGVFPFSTMGAYSRGGLCDTNEGRERTDLFSKLSVPVIGVAFLLTGCGGAVTCDSLQADLEELTQEIAGDFAAAQARAAEYDALLDQVLEMGCAQ